MGVTKADDIRRLYASHYSPSLSGSDAAAFQLAVWEIVYESSAHAYTLNSGLLAALGTSVTTLATANNFLSTMGTAKASLAALSSPNQQDQLVLVPLPTAAWMGLGLLASAAGVSYARRRSVVA
jgi:hypothetical protein